MEQAFGRIIAIQTADSPLRAEVEVKGALRCARCAAGRGCGAALLGGAGGERARRVAATIASGIDVREGDRVCMELSSRRLLRASWLVYGLPLAAGLVTAALADSAGLGDASAAVAALLGVVAGALVARSRLRKATCLRQFTPTIVARVPAEP